MYLEGLDETVRITKTANGAFAVRADGSRTDLSVLRALDGKARVRRFGALTSGFAAYLAQRPPAEQLPLAVFYRVPAPGMPATSADRVAAQTEVVARAGEGLRASLASLGIEASLEPGVLPVLWVRATRKQTEQIARLDEVVLVTHDQGVEGAGQFANPSPIVSVSAPHITSTYNSSGNYGKGQRVGFVEGAACGAFDPHEAFKFTNDGAGPLGGGITYHAEPKSCATDADCATACEEGGYRVLGGATCASLGRPGKGKQCYSPHLTGTMSLVAASSATERFGAAEVSLYVANRSVDGTGVACSPRGIAGAYNWFVANAVSLVNESFRCPSDDRLDQTTSSLDGITQDYFSSAYGTTTFRAAGNDRANGGIACPYSLNSICVGSMTKTGAASCYSNTRNPQRVPGSKAEGDREEPDVLALGGGSADVQNCTTVNDVAVANPAGGASDWTYESGTSAAAPVAAALAALLQTDCGVTSSDPLWLRSWMRTLAYDVNPTGTSPARRPPTR